MKLIYFTLLLVLFLQPLTLAQVANVSALAHEANMENSNSLPNRSVR